MSEFNDIKKIPEGTFPIKLKLIQKYRRAEPRITKYKNGTYHKGSFCGGSNIGLNLITCDDKTIIPSKLKKLCIILVPYVSPSCRHGENGGNDSPKFVLAWYHRCRPKGSK